MGRQPGWGSRPPQVPTLPSKATAQGSLFLGFFHGGPVIEGETVGPGAPLTHGARQSPEGVAPGSGLDLTSQQGDPKAPSLSGTRQGS